MYAEFVALAITQPGEGQNNVIVGSLVHLYSKEYKR